MSKTCEPHENEVMSEDTDARFRAVVARDGRYHADAYDFLFESLRRAAERVHGRDTGEKPRHVTGRQLCEAARDLALETWGAMAKVVLNEWGIGRTRDFGEMVFLLVEHGFMGKRDEDVIEDFDDVYSFEGAFEKYDISVSKPTENPS